MATSFKNKYGEVSISSTVVANLACASVMETYGVVGLASKNAKDGIYQLLGIENMRKGVKIYNNEDNSIDVKISLFLEYGVRIAVVAENIMEKVKYNIENSLDIKVRNVNILIQGIRK
ncbi:MAG: Asp23/Gls24 family envelope stress response protein [Tissierellia bacterium]|nr:Asp23/Gls24 family envelope stress response protein [Tissierellia bacterium]